MNPPCVYFPPAAENAAPEDPHDECLKRNHPPHSNHCEFLSGGSQCPWRCKFRGLVVLVLKKAVISDAYRVIEMTFQAGDGFFDFLGDGTKIHVPHYVFGRLAILVIVPVQCGAMIAMK